jgi:predicted SnoaL-like aldol condensation-catalyzing enzyme
MSSEANKAVVRAYIEMWNTGNAALAATVLGPKYVDHAHPEVSGLPSFVQALQQVRSAFPDFHISIATMIGEGEWVAVRATIRRTQQGEVRISRVIWFVRIEGGKMAELWTGTEAS